MRVCLKIIICKANKPTPITPFLAGFHNPMKIVFYYENVLTNGKCGSSVGRKMTFVTLGNFAVLQISTNKFCLVFDDDEIFTCNLMLD